MQNHETGNQSTTAVRADVCVAGSGIVGLVSALQHAKRGLSVVIVDELTERGTSAYKVGESLLGFTNAFLRSIGDLDAEVGASFPKHGVWFTWGLEGKQAFDGEQSEFGVQSKLPERWRANAGDPRFMRTMFQDAQIVRPEIEAVLRRRLAEFPNITVIDNGLVKDVRLGADGDDHLVTWQSRSGDARGTVASRWLVDCSGRARLLVKRFGHRVPLDDGFDTSAVWGQFAGCSDADFGEGWKFTFPEGQQTQRYLDTVHLWGDGYWIWLIRLSRDRISVGVSFRRNQPPAEGNLRSVFWEILRRYPMLDFLKPEDLLDFAAYRDPQHITDTYVSEQRYAIAGDAASIIDAYYSQGISLALAESWHAANIAERDVRDGVLDTDYIAHVNKGALADWRMMRGMVKGKYGPAMADSRFFMLDHMLDYLVFGAGLPGRYRIARWLTDTRGRTEDETPELARLRGRLSRRLFLSQSPPFHRFDPTTVATVLQRFRDGIERRARWRLQHGVRPRPMTAIMRTDAPLPAIWRLPYLALRSDRSMSMKSVEEPEFLRPDITTKLPAALDGIGSLLVLMCGYALAYDMVDTTVRKLVQRVRAGGAGAADQPVVADESAEPASSESIPVVGAGTRAGTRAAG